MERAGFRLGIVGLGLTSALVSALFFAVAAHELERPKRVGVHLEFPAENGADEAFMAGVRRSLPRLLASAQAEDVVVADVDASTLEVTFVPAQAWSEIHGLRIDDEDKAPELVPDGLRTLLTTPRDLRVLEIAHMQSGGEVERDRAARLLDHHPERALDVLRTALHEAEEKGHAVAWIPRASGSGPLTPVLVDGSNDRQITILDLASASRGQLADEIQLSFDGTRRAKLEPYLQELFRRRMAIVVDGAFEGVGKAVYHNHYLDLVGEEEGELSPETCAAIVAWVREPLSPRAPRITRSWIMPKKMIADAVVALVIGAASALLAVALVLAFVRDMRRRVVVKKAADWSSAA